MTSEELKEFTSSLRESEDAKLSRRQADSYVKTYRRMNRELSEAMMEYCLGKNDATILKMGLIVAQAEHDVLDISEQVLAKAYSLGKQRAEEQIGVIASEELPELSSRIMEIVGCISSSGMKIRQQLAKFSRQKSLDENLYNLVNVKNILQIVEEDSVCFGESIVREGLTDGAVDALENIVVD